MNIKHDIGKVSPLQLIIITFLEAIFYSINKSVFCVGVINFFDGMKIYNFKKISNMISNIIYISVILYMYI